MKNIKILACYHKPDILLRSKMVIPIHVGRSIASPKTQKSLKRIIGDDTGENISSLNPWYAELTGLYWAWKNPEQLGNPNYIGLMHYRRFFQDIKDSYDGNDPKDFYRNFRKQYLHQSQKLRVSIEESDIICPVPYILKDTSIAQTYAKLHVAEDFNEIIQIAEDLYPQYTDTIKEFPNTQDAYLCNMSIMKKEIFCSYCEFIFSILEQFRQRRDLSQYTGYQTRVLGFLGERLTSLFIAIQRQHNPLLTIRQMQSIYRDKEPDPITHPKITAKDLWRHPKLIFKKRFWKYPT